MPGGPVEVAAYETLPEAYHTKGYLESRGIRAFVADELTGTWLGIYNRSIGGIRVMVAPEDVDRALAELETLEHGTRGSSAGVPEESEAEPEEEREGTGEEEEGDPSGAAVSTGLSPPEEDVGASAPSGPRTEEDDPGGVRFAVRTRMFAVLCLAAVFLAPFVLFRSYSTPPGVELSARARSVLRQARILSILGVLIFGILFRLMFFR
jgi:hypothetical protein